MNKMRIYFDKYNQPEQPKVYLATPNRKIICPLNGIDEETFDLQLNLNNTWELSFDVNRYIIVEKNEKKEQVESNGYSSISVLLRIYVEGIGWFILNPPSVSGEGYKEYKSITASSAEIEMQQHDLKTLKINTGTTDSYEMLVEGNVDKVGDVEFAKEQIKFYNPQKPELSFLNILLKVSNMHGWTIGYIDDIPKTYRNYKDGKYEETQVKLSDEIGTFDIDTQDLYSFLTQDAAKFFSCIFVFDCLNFKINAYRPENLGKNTNINIGFRNTQNSNDVSIDENIFTRYYVQGGDDLGITYVNFGDNYIENLTYLTNEKYMSKGLIKKYKLWKDDLEAKRLIYIENTRLYNKQQSVISELYNRVPLDDCSTDWSTFPDDKLLEAQANYRAQLKGYESFYVDEDGNFDEEALKASPDANDYYQIKDVILPSIQIEIDNRNLPPNSEDKEDYIDSYKTDWKLYGLDELSVNIEIYKNNKKLAEDAKCTEPYNPETSTQTEDYHNKMYELYSEAVKQLDSSFVGSCQEAYDKRKEEIDNAEAIQKQYDDIRKDCNTAINKETWKHKEGSDEYSFSEQDLADLSKLYIDADYTNDNMFITNSDDAVTMIDEQLKLMDAASEDLDSASREQFTYTTSLDNFLALYDYRNYTNNLELGDFIYLGVRDDYVVKLRVISISYNPLKMDNNISITFSNMIQSRAGRDDFAYLLDSGSGAGKNSASGNGNDFVQNDGVGLTSGLIQKLLASGAFLNQLNQIINNGSIVVPGGSMSLTELNTKMIKVLDLFAENGFFEYLQAKLIVADKIVADSGEFKELSALVAMIDNLIAGNVSAELGHIIHLTAESVSIDEAVIREIIAAQITVSMLKAGEISADKFNIKSDDGGLEIVGNTMKFKDENGVTRIQIGRDTNNNFTFCLYDETGKGVLIDSTGIKDSAISDGLIVNDMIANGTLGKEKMNFEILETDESGNIVQNGKVVIDKNGIDAEFTTIKNSVTNIQGQIDNLGDTLPSAMNVILGNESQPIPCDNNGYTLESMLIEIPFLGYAGLNKTPVTAKIGVLPNGMTIGEIKNSTVDQDGLITLNISKNANLGNENILNGKIPITFTIKDRTVSKSFYWTKAKSGADGTVKLYELSSSIPVLSKDVDGEINPKNITFSSTIRNSNEISKKEYNGLFVIKESIDGVKYEIKYTSVNSESSTNYIISSNDVVSLQCILCESDKVSNELDIVTIPVLSNDSLKQEITNIKSQMSGVSTKVDAVEKSIENKVWQSDITTEINNYDNTTVKTVRDQVAEQKTELGKISNTVSNIETRVETKADGTTVQALTEKVTKIEQDADGFKQTVENNYSTKEETNSIKSELTQQADRIEQKVKDNAGNISSLTTSVSGITSRVEDAKKNISTLTQTSTKLTSELKNAQGDITKLKETAEGLELEVKNAKNDIASLNVTTEGIKSTVAKKQDIGITAIRYIRDWLNGSNVDETNKWVECKVVSNKNNITEGIKATCLDENLSPVEVNNIERYTDGILIDEELTVENEDNFCVVTNGGMQCLQLDLGEIHYDIDYIQVWHYYIDNRIFNHKLQVSTDGVSWVTLCDSTASGGYAEEHDGHSHYVSSESITTNMTQVSQTVDEINSSVTSLKGDLSNINQDISGITTTVTTNKENVNKANELLANLKNDFENKNKENSEKFAQLKVDTEGISSSVVAIEKEITNLSNITQDAFGWKAMFKNLGMTEADPRETNIVIDINGITVTNPNTGQITKMKIDGFSGYYNEEKVFWIEKDTTKTVRVLCKKGWDTDIIKMTTNSYTYPDGTKLNGTAYVKSGGTS